MKFHPIGKTFETQMNAGRVQGMLEPSRRKVLSIYWVFTPRTERAA